MGILDFFKTKKITEYSRKELVKIARDHKLEFEAEIKDTDLQKLVENAIKSATQKSVKKIKIEFILSPTGKFNLGYNAGEVAELPELQATELIEAKYAKKVK